MPPPWEVVLAIQRETQNPKTFSKTANSDQAQRSFTKLRTGCATSTCMRDKHEDRPGDPNMRGHSDLDNMEVRLVCETEQTELRSPGKQAADTSSKMGEGVDLEQDSGE